MQARLSLMLANVINTRNYVPGRIGQSIMCLTADTCGTANRGVAGLNPARSHTLAEIDHEIISINSISIYAFVLILCMFTMYVCCISFVFIE